MQVSLSEAPLGGLVFKIDSWLKFGNLQNKTLHWLNQQVNIHLQGIICFEPISEKPKPEPAINLISCHFHLVFSPFPSPEDQLDV